MHLYTFYRAGLACSHTQSKQTHTRKVISGFITGNEEENVAGLRKKKEDIRHRKLLALWLNTLLLLSTCGTVCLVLHPTSHLSSLQINTL